MLALNFLPFFKDSVDEIETGGENRDGSVLPETSQSVARLPSVSSPLPGPSGVRPPTPQLVTSVRHSRGRKRRTKAKASSLKKTHRHRRSAPLPPVPHQASSAPCAASGSGLGGVVEGWRTSTPPPEPVPPMRGGEEDAVSYPTSPSPLHAWRRGGCGALSSFPPPPPEVAWSPDTDHPDAWVRREDVILK
ncbi:hypothetical protein Pmani_019305 [Petrolisthes manimaculis]|uniref:Uncharacterized protein n=1 Tax=Petrolisthes manimaculis TaxID=1843537 RepID=A0AAE1PIQ0_9EUCA|nr:hypothetical protein Pmani_019305 [Petrolisthes manimaculis]